MTDAGWVAVVVVGLAALGLILWLKRTNLPGRGRLEQTMPPLITSLPPDMMGRYKVLLQLKDPSGALLRHYEEMLRTMPGAAHLEALTFSMLQGIFHLEPEIHDVPGVGGPDFRTLAHPTPLYVEAKYLERESVANRSGVPDAVLDEGGNFEQITSKIKNRVRDADDQLKLRADGPGIAVIGTDHAQAAMLMSTLAVQWMLTGTTQMQVPINGAGPAREVATLQDSVWFTHPPAAGQDFERLRVAVSAVLLMTFNLDTQTVSLLGVLNPWPRPGLALPILHFPKVPFAKFATPPVANPGAELPPIEWVIYDPEPASMVVLRPEIPGHMVRGENPPRRII